jgi:WD40 repeat protein
LIQMVCDYDAINIVQKNIVFVQNHGHKFNDPNESPQNVSTFLLELSMCRNLICEIITLDNGLLVSGSFHGMIQIWDPMTGDCLKKIDTLEKSFTESREHVRSYPQILKMCQVSDELIAITYFNVHYGASNNVIVMNIITGELQVLNKINMYTSTSSIYRIQSDYFVTDTDNAIKKWYITDDQKVEFISTNYPVENPGSYLLMDSDTNTLMLSKITTTTHAITSINKTSDTEIYYLLEPDEVVFHSQYWIVNEYFFARLRKARTHKITRFIVLRITNESIDHIVATASDSTFIQSDDREITHIIHVIDNLIAVIEATKSGDGTIKILDMKNNFICVKQFDIGNVRIRTATRYADGLITVNYLSEIKVYEFI